MKLASAFGKGIVVVATLVVGFVAGCVFGSNAAFESSRRMDMIDIRNLNAGFLLLQQNTTGRVAEAQVAWTEETNGVIRVIIAGKLGQTTLEIDEEGKFLGGKIVPGP